MEQLTSEILNWADSSFKYILIAFNFMTLIVVYIHKSRQQRKKQHHVLFVTAHPDDEVMFFRPSLSSINKDYFVHLLCLSGKGTERQEQLKKSVQKLQLHRLECIKNQNLKDSMECEWPRQQIKSIVLKYVSEHNIKAIFTFDQYGVSGHLNHKSIGVALKQLHYPREQLKILNKKVSSQNEEEKKKVELIKQESIKIYHLLSVNLIRKYTGVLEIVLALIKDFSWININFINAYNSMAVHKSQFLWYRKLWVIFSQYSYINTYSMSRIRIKTSSSENASQRKIEENTHKQVESQKQHELSNSQSFKGLQRQKND